MTQTAHVGDVFLVPIEGPRSGIGQIAGDWKGELYVIIYDRVIDDGDIDPATVVNEKPLLAALSLDAKIHHGDWRIIGNVTENLDNIPQPVFKVNQGDTVFVESRDRSMTRPASDAEAKELRLRTVVAPVRPEKALQAHHGVGDWISKYDDLLYDYAWKSSQFILD